MLPLAMLDYMRVVSCFVGVTAEMQNLVQRRIYPFLLMVVVLMGILSFQVRQFKRLYEHIKNDKWVYSTFLVAVLCFIFEFIHFKY